MERPIDRSRIEEQTEERIGKRVEEQIEERIEERIGKQIEEKKLPVKFQEKKTDMRPKSRTQIQYWTG